MVQSSSKAWLISLLGLALINIKAVCSGAAPTFSDPNMSIRASRTWPATHNTRLKCKAIGAPPLKYTWLKDGERMQTRQMDPFLNSSLWYLKLKDLVPQDSGKYTCIVSNPYGSINHTYTLKVVAKARSKPILQKGLPRNKTVEIGGNATMECIVLVTGTPPDFRWLKWNKSITSVPKPNINDNLANGSYQLIDPHYYKTIQVGEHYGVELTITDVTEDDFGLYTCVASNHIGMDYSSAFLRRHVKPSPLASDKVPSQAQRNTSSTTAVPSQAQRNTSSTTAVTEREKTSWTSRIQYPWALIGVSVAVIIALIIVTVWFCWKLKKVRTYAGRPSSGIASLQPKYDVHNEYVVIPDFK